MYCDSDASAAEWAAFLSAALPPIPDPTNISSFHNAAGGAINLLSQFPLGLMVDYEVTVVTSDMGRISSR